MEEFRVIQDSKTHGHRDLDGVIVLDGLKRILPRVEHKEQGLHGKDIIVIQTKTGRLGMTLLGQALFSRELMRIFEPRTIMSVAVCERDDDILRPLAEKYGVEVVCLG